MSSIGTMRDDTLVAMTASHLVARLQLALHRNEDLDHLHHARRQLVAALQLLDLVLEPVNELLDRSHQLRPKASSSCITRRPRRRSGATGRRIASAGQRQYGTL